MRVLQVLFVSGVLLVASCKKDKNVSTSSDSIGGDTNLETNVVGYKYSCYANVTGVTASEVKVVSNDNGVVTVNVSATVPTTGTTLTNLIPATYKDASGKVNVSGKFKNTSEGILDYTNSDNKPFVLVKYDDNVGTKYTLKKSNGQTITRTIVSKSTTDDYPWGLMNIKVMVVEQDSRIPGVSKIRYMTNHKFGLVGIEFVMEDGTTSKISIM